MFSYTQKVLACIMIAILCVLAAMFSVDQLSTFTPHTAAEGATLVAIAVLFLVVLVYLCYRVMHCGGAHESFAVSQREWGNSGYTDMPAPYDPEHSTRIVGPDPKKEELYTWQYNPQNTLVDYKFYETERCDSATPVAPLIDGAIGKRNQPMEMRAGEGLCNNNAAGTAYGVQSPASAQPVPTATTQWSAA